MVFFRERQARFFGHVMGREGMDNTITTGKISGKRSRGRQRMKHTNGLKMWLQKENNELIHSVRDRIKYREMIANAIRQGT